MTRRTQTYAIRLAVEGGGQVKAELVTVGQSGEQSLKRIESAGDRASGGLKGLGRQAELLRTGIRTLGGALIGVTTVGGLDALVDRSISATDAIGKSWAPTDGPGRQVIEAAKILAIERSRAPLNSSADCSATSPSTSAREKLATTPWLRAKRAFASSRE